VFGRDDLGMNSQNFVERLNSLEEQITNSDFLDSKGIGNEVPYYIFTYPAQEEERLSRHLALINLSLKSITNLKFIQINLFNEAVNLLKDNHIYQDVIEMQQTGVVNSDVLYALQGELNETNLASYINQRYQLDSFNLILLTGVGGCHPMISVSKMLSNLQSLTMKCPLVVFYPGEYTKNTAQENGAFSLFNLINRESYYRAFKL